MSILGRTRTFLPVSRNLIRTCQAASHHLTLGDTTQHSYKSTDVTELAMYMYHNISCSGHSCFALELVAGSDQYADAYAGEHHSISFDQYTTA